MYPNNITITTNINREGKKVFALFGGILFSIISFFSMIDLFDFFPAISGNDESKYLIYYFLQNSLFLAECILISETCFARRKNVFALVAAVFPFGRWLIVTAAGSFLYGTYSLTGAEVILAFSYLTFVGLGILSCIPKIAEKCKWVKYLGAIPGTIYFLYIVIVLGAPAYHISGFQMIILYCFLYVPAYVHFGLWMASPDVENIELSPNISYVINTQQTPAQPQYQQPAYQTPAQPQYQQPAYQTSAQPQYQQYQYQAPAYQTPAQPQYATPQQYIVPEQAEQKQDTTAETVEQE